MKLLDLPLLELLDPLLLELFVIERQCGLGKNSKERRDIFFTFLRDAECAPGLKIFWFLKFRNFYVFACKNIEISKL